MDFIDVLMLINHSLTEKKFVCEQSANVYILIKSIKIKSISYNEIRISLVCALPLTLSLPKVTIIGFCKQHRSR